MKVRTSRRTMLVTLGSVAAGWPALARSGDPSSIVIHGAGPTGAIARIAIQLNFRKREIWIFEIAGRSVSLGGAKELLQDGWHNARKPIPDGVVRLRKQGDASETEIACHPRGIAMLADVPPGSYAAVIEVPSRNMRLGGKFKVTAEGFVNEAKLEVL